MPATINLLPRKEFEITLSDGTVISGQYTTWALKRYGEKLGLTLQQSGEQLTNPGLNDMVEYLLSAVEYTARKNKQPFSYTDLQACDWIDDMGGIQSLDLIRLFRHSGDEQPVAEEKKTTES